MVDGRTDGHVITKFSLIYRLSGAPLCAFSALERSATNTNTPKVGTNTYTKYNLLSSLSQISPPFQGKKFYKPFNF